MNPIPALLGVAIALLAGCATTPEQRANQSAVADGASTLAAVAAGASELNPLGLATIALKYPVLEYIKTLPDGERETMQSAASSVWNGLAVNNICILAAIAACGPCAIACPLMGIGYGYRDWQESEAQRNFYTACADAKQRWGMTEKCAYSMEAKE